MGRLVAAHHPDLVVIACNTASTIALPTLRARFAVPFVGTVPAIKPACAASASKLVSVLGTEATVAREYTRALIRDYAQDCRVTLVGSKKLAAYAEAELRGTPLTDAAIQMEIAPCFCDDGAPGPRQAALTGYFGAFIRAGINSNHAWFAATLMVCPGFGGWPPTCWMLCRPCHENS